MAVIKKDPAAVALGRKGGQKGGPARAARLTPEQRSESARKAAAARWAKAKRGGNFEVASRGRAGARKFSVRKQINQATRNNVAVNTSDQALLALLQRIKTTDNPTEIRHLTDQLEQLIFHRQFKNA